MYNEPPATPFTRRNFLIIISAVIVISIVVFITTHGFLAVDNVTNKSVYTYTSYANDLKPDSSSSSSSFQLMSSGDYSVQMPLPGGGIDTKYVSVPRLLMTAKTQRDTGEKKIETLGRGVIPRLALVGGGLAAWEDSGSMYVIDQNKISNSESISIADESYPEFEQFVQVDKSLVGGFTRSEDNSIFPTFHNLSTNDNQLFQPYSPGEDVVVKKEANGFSIYDSNSRTYRLYLPGKDEPVSFKQDDTPVAQYDRKALYSISPKKSILVTGGEIMSVNEDESVDIENANFRVKIFSTTDKKLLLDESLDASINEVTVSTDGSYIYIRTNESMTIYDTATFKRVYATPYLVNDFVWLSDDSFAYTTGEQGMFIGSAKNGTARTVTPYDVLRPTQISFVDDEWVYFTAYTDKNTGAKDPDAYRVSYKSSADQQDMKILREFPKTGSGYYIDYINGRLVVQLTRYVDSSGSFDDEEAKSAVSVYVSDFFGNNTPETIYDYKVFDLRPQIEQED